MDPASSGLGSGFTNQFIDDLGVISKKINEKKHLLSPASLFDKIIKHPMQINDVERDFAKSLNKYANNIKLIEHYIEMLQKSLLKPNLDESDKKRITNEIEQHLHKLEGLETNFKTIKQQIKGTKVAMLVNKNINKTINKINDINNNIGFLKVKEGEAKKPKLDALLSAVDRIQSNVKSIKTDNMHLGAPFQKAMQKNKMDLAVIKQTFNDPRNKIEAGFKARYAKIINKLEEEINTHLYPYAEKTETSKESHAPITQPTPEVSEKSSLNESPAPVDEQKQEISEENILFENELNYMIRDSKINAHEEAGKVIDQYRNLTEDLEMIIKDIGAKINELKDNPVEKQFLEALLLKATKEKDWASKAHFFTFQSNKLSLYLKQNNRVKARDCVVNIMTILNNEDFKSGLGFPELSKWFANQKHMDAAVRLTAELKQSSEEKLLDETMHTESKERTTESVEHFVDQLEQLSIIIEQPIPNLNRAKVCVENMIDILNEKDFKNSPIFPVIKEKLINLDLYDVVNKIEIDPQDQQGSLDKLKVLDLLGQIYESL